LAAFEFLDGLKRDADKLATQPESAQPTLPHESEDVPI
jgi:hypothetical protein